MKCTVALALLLSFGHWAHASLLRGAGQQPTFKGKVNSDDEFATSAQDGKPGRAPGYRAAWDDCGGIGASATSKMRNLAAKINGWGKPIPFIRHAAQDCGAQDQSGTVPGPSERVNYPGPEIGPIARKGLKIAADTLKRHPAAVKEKAEYVGHLFH
mmetsp:Transcript_59660/g.184950  ORF Transcript_59660/g.184950 Transcript_59660/m.184950 type:complete len:156 (+) Transcript_59660:51-518(+)